MGRVSTYTVEMADEIVERISEGETLREICRGENAPSWKTVYRWIESNSDFATRIARARELGEDAIAQECLEIADNATNDWMAQNGDDNDGYRLNGEHVQRSKLRIDTRLKLLAKWNPKKYGDKVQVGGDKDNPVRSVLQIVTGVDRED
jgi:hypothetical protein